MFTKIQGTWKLEFYMQLRLMFFLHTVAPLNRKRSRATKFYLKLKRNGLKASLYIKDEESL